MDKKLGQGWTRCVEIGQSQKNLSNTTSRKQPQESSRRVTSHKIVTQQKSSQKYPLMRMNRHRSTCETHGQTDGRTDRRTDGRTGSNQYTPPSPSVAGGIIILFENRKCNLYVNTDTRNNRSLFDISGSP